MFKINNKDFKTTSMMSFWCFYFAPILHIFSGVSTVDFEYVFVCRFTGKH